MEQAWGVCETMAARDAQLTRQIAERERVERIQRLVNEQVLY